jgi:hypothetical protein
MKEWQFWTVTGVAGLALIIVVVNIVLFMQNRSLQVEVNNRQLFINQSTQLEQLNKEIITALANLSVKNNDEDLNHLLAMHGITVSVTQNAPTEQGERSPAKGRK